MKVSHGEKVIGLIRNETGKWWSLRSGWVDQIGLAAIYTEDIDTSFMPESWEVVWFVEKPF